jgi:DNA-binding PadR family transcriptional regulator
MPKPIPERIFDLSPKDEAVLASVRYRERYGLEIIEAVKEASKGKIKLGFGSLYPTLHKLEEKGFLEARWGDETPEERGGARRRYYGITGLGEKVLQEKQRFLNEVAEWQPVLEGL